MDGSKCPACSVSNGSQPMLAFHILLTLWVDINWQSEHTSSCVFGEGRIAILCSIRWRGCVHGQRYLSWGILCLCYSNKFFTDSEFNTVLTLKSSQDRTFGCNAVADSPEVFFTNSEVLMKVEIDIEKVEEFDPKYLPYFALFAFTDAY